MGGNAWKFIGIAAAVGLGLGALTGSGDEEESPVEDTGGEAGESGSTIAEAAKTDGGGDPDGQDADAEEGEALTCPDCGENTLADGTPIRTEAQLHGHRGTHR